MGKKILLKKRRRLKKRVLKKFEVTVDGQVFRFREFSKNGAQKTALLKYAYWRERNDRM